MASIPPAMTAWGLLMDSEGRLRNDGESLELATSVGGRKSNVMENRLVIAKSITNVN
jgi:hypothetical protein